MADTPLDRYAFTYSVVIPVFNSEKIVATTVERTAAFFEREGLRYEIVLVNDGSHDGSWEVVRELAGGSRPVRALNLLRNYGQHNANLAGFRHAGGDYVVTMDDDLQNPPEEIAKLVDGAMKGHDVVFGAFEHKQAPRYRSLGTRLIAAINRRIFGKPKDLEVSNFRILRRDVVDRICGSRSYPYITGQALLYSHDPANVAVAHAPRAEGKSNYNLLRISRLVLRILFSYSSFPLRLSAGIGFVIALGSFLTGAFFFVRGLLGESDVPGFTALVVLLSFLNGVVILMLSMLGEYVVRTLNQVSAVEQYHVVETAGLDA